MNNKIYELPSIEKVPVVLEQTIAGSVPVTPADPNNGFTENWEEETIITGDIELLT